MLSSHSTSISVGVGSVEDIIEAIFSDSIGGDSIKCVRRNSIEPNHTMLYQTSTCYHFHDRLPCFNSVRSSVSWAAICHRGPCNCTKLYETALVQPRQLLPNVGSAMRIESRRQILPCGILLWYPQGSCPSRVCSCDISMSKYTFFQTGEQIRIDQCCIVAICVWLRVT